MKTNGMLRGELLLCAVLAMGLAWLMLPTAGERKRELLPQARLARDNLRQLLVALDQYREAHHGRFPHDERGPEYALYLVRPYLDAKHLACGPAEDPQQLPFWDETEGRARNAGWDYLNVADPWQIPAEQIIVASRPSDFPALMYFGDRIGSIRCRRVMSRDESKVMLGSCFSDEGFLVASKETLEEWERLGPKGLGWQTTSTGTGTVIETTHPTRSVNYEYDYRDERLAARRIRCGVRQIVERVRTDGFGRIIAIERTPDDWKDIWLQCASDEERDQGKIGRPPGGA